MHIILTGYSHKTESQKQVKFADLRFVAVPDEGDNPNENYRQNPNRVLTFLMDTITDRCKNTLAKFKVTEKNINLEVGDASNNQFPSLHIAVLFNLVNDFLDSKMWTEGIVKILNGMKIPYSYDLESVKHQILNEATEDDYNAASELTDKFIDDLFKRFDEEDVKKFLQNFVGGIRMLGASEKGWEFVQFSDRNSIMIYAQYKAQGIVPRFVSTERNWAKYFNRKLIPNAIGAVIEVPYKNKYNDPAGYEAITNSSFVGDLKAGGTRGYLANRVGRNHNAPPTNGEWEYGYVYDESQTELMTDNNGQPMEDVLNLHDKYQRRVTNVGNDLTMVSQPEDVEVPQQQQEPTEQAPNPFNENNSKAEKCLQNILASIKVIQNGSHNTNKYDSIVPMIEQINNRHNFTTESLSNVLKEIAMIELLQKEKFVKGRIPVGRESYARLATSITLLCCKMGGDDTNTKQLIDNCLVSQHLSIMVYDTVVTLTNLIKGTLIESLLIEDSELCYIPSYEEFLEMCGIDENFFKMQQLRAKQKINEINESFKSYLKRIL